MNVGGGHKYHCSAVGMSLSRWRSNGLMSVSVAASTLTLRILSCGDELEAVNEPGFLLACHEAPGPKKKKKEFSCLGFD